VSRSRSKTSKSQPKPLPTASRSNGRAAANSRVRKEIVFRFEASKARRVVLAADFTNWEKSAIDMARDQAGVWQAKIQLGMGRYHYKFIVDGEWHDDPRCLIHVPNQFGTTNAVVEVV
jgi:1,4-alpha-glucan branching enzyme